MSGAVSGPVDVLRAMRNASFELVTVTTGNEGRAAAALDQAAEVVRETQEALQTLVHLYGRRDGETLLPAAQQPVEIRAAMRTLARATGAAS